MIGGIVQRGGQLGREGFVLGVALGDVAADLGGLGDADAEGVGEAGDLADLGRAEAAVGDGDQGSRRKGG